MAWLATMSLRRPLPGSHSQLSQLASQGSIKQLELRLCRQDASFAQQAAAAATQGLRMLRLLPELVLGAVGETPLTLHLCRHPVCRALESAS